MNINKVITPPRVKWVHGHWLGTFEKNYPFPEPIPLDETWLKRFGFEISTGLTWSSGYTHEYNVFRRGNLTYNGVQSAWWFDGKLLHRQPESVHELQNLYFALTGEELKLKEA